ncbi:hypothetical protein IJ182_07260 [bacterium]|nr:hypothetical protein [bacterium]
MEKLCLNTKQISELIRNNRVFIQNNTAVEIFDDEFILNCKGKITKSKSLSISFREMNEPYSFLQALICEYFNFEYQNVICISASIEESEFRIRFSPQKELSIIVCPKALAIKNTENIFEDDIQNHLSENQIGFYRRLGNSDYFFRWNEDL